MSNRHFAFAVFLLHFREQERRCATKDVSSISGIGFSIRAEDRGCNAGKLSLPPLFAILERCS